MMISSTAPQAEIYDSDLFKVIFEHVRSEMLHRHRGVAPGAFVDITNSSSIDGLVCIQDYVLDEYLAW